MAAYADCVLALDVDRGKRGYDGHRTLRCVKQRAFPEFAPLQLKLTPIADGSAAFFKRCLGGATISLPGSKAQIRADILDDLNTQPPTSGSAIAKRIGRNKQGVLDELRDMAAAGLIHFDQYTGWRLKI
jgi:hypothetical protein